MSIEANKQVVRDYFKAFLAKDVAWFRDHIEPGFRRHDPGLPFEVVGPRIELHSVEGLTLLGLPPVRLSRSSAMLKRAIDVVGAVLGLLLTAPIFLVAAWRIKRESPGPVFFRQTRLAMGMKEFTALKFRTMHVGVDTLDILLEGRRLHLCIGRGVAPHG